MADVNALIERWQKGDQRAAEALYNHHRDTVYRLSYGLLGDPADAEEVAQDALTYALVYMFSVYMGDGYGGFRDGGSSPYCCS